MSQHDYVFKLNVWLNSQWSKLEKASAALERDAQCEDAIAQIEKIVRSYKEKADEGTIFQTVIGFDETVLRALEVLAAAYARVARFDEALALHRYVAETVQSIVQGRHRNRQRIQDVRNSDIDHFTNTVGFLVYFSRHAANQGERTQARQLLNEAIRLSDAWDLATSRPEVGQGIRQQIEALGRLSKQGGNADSVV